MGTKAGRVLFAAACLLWLAGCSTSSRLDEVFSSQSDAGLSGQGAASESEPATTGTAAPVAADGLSGAADRGRTKRPAKAAPDKDAGDDLALGKKHFAAGNATLAERHFRRAVERDPAAAESWLGLAACYDRQHKFERADRAYDEAVKIAGPTAEILNNRGYSYMLRGDAKRARATLLEAQGKDPGNAFVKNNLELLEANVRKAKATQ
jgi:Flp pilus assembly protein TadD